MSRVKILIVAAVALSILIVVAVIVAGAGYFCLNRYPQTGTLVLKGLKAPVTVLRDDKGMAYIQAENRDDLMIAWGFVTAQDRLFQMETTKLFACGRIGELAGEKAEALDVRMRTIGFRRQAEKQAAALNQETRRFIELYLSGVNQFIENFKDEYPLEFKLAGIQPEPWTPADSLAILFYMSWNSSANIQTEIIAQMLADKLGLEKAREIFPLNINPEDPGTEPNLGPVCGPTTVQKLALAGSPLISSYLEHGRLSIGSNNWAVGPERSASGYPILANDPHLDAHILPGPWYPIGLFTPEFRVVGAGIAGIPFIVVGRTEHVAFGVTNSYGDSQDLYVETIDPNNPDHYLEGGESIPFEVIEETLTFKDKKAPGGKTTKVIRIRTTKRGPVISSIFPDLKTEKVLTLRWAPFETMAPELGADRLMTAKTVKDVRDALSRLNLLILNYVFADDQGGIGWVVTGKLPIRSQGESTVPFVVEGGTDNWTGWIPYEEMPQSLNPDKGWLGTCNHDTITSDFPYYYSSHLAPSYRYRRLMELLAEPKKTTAQDHWGYQLDDLNLMAKVVAPIMTRVLLDHEETQDLGRLLANWDFRDDPDLTSPTIFQAVYRQFAIEVFKDELGEDLAMAMLSDWYFWQERLQQMVVDNNSPWFDDVTTNDVEENRDEIFYRAALEAKRELTEKAGPPFAGWTWGRVHPDVFVSPLRTKFGGATYPAGGSAETLLRGLYDFQKPFDVKVQDSMRMVADLGDKDKVLAVIPGGSTARILNPHTKDQLCAYSEGRPLYWWFSDAAIKRNAKSKQVLKP